MPTESFLVAGLRTPIGSLGGALSAVSAPDLGATCVRALLERTEYPAADVDEVILGNVISAGVGQNPARQAAIRGGIPASVPAATVNKVCGSGLKAVMFADQAIRLGEAHAVVAGGMENMSLAPYLLPQARKGYRLGNGELVDAMLHDGLWDIYNRKSMGCFGDQCAAKFGLSREEQDDFAVRSYTRALRAIEGGTFKGEIVPVEISGRKGSTLVSEDEEPGRFQEEKLRSLRPAFSEGGTVTAGNASSVNDGAAALLVMSKERCIERGIAPIARIVGSATFSREPEWFTIAPIDAIRKLLTKVGWSVEETDLFEINEAFSCVAMAAQRELSIPDEKLNILGGAVGLGHPIGASGARVVVTLLTALARKGGRRGIACLCVGGGEAVAIAVERVE